MRKPQTTNNSQQIQTNSQESQVKLSINCTFDDRAFIKMLAARSHVTMSEYILSHLRHEFPEQKTPNAETLEAMKEIDDGGGTVCESLADFWEKMGIDRSA